MIGMDCSDSLEPGIVYLGCISATRVGNSNDLHIVHISVQGHRHWRIVSPLSICSCLQHATPFEDQHSSISCSRHNV